MENKILIIGGSGFVGTRLIDHLGSNNILNFDKKNSHCYEEITTIGDITNIDDLKLSKSISTVVLLAAEHRDDVLPKSLYYDVNVQGTKNVLKAMDMAGIKNLIFTSSVAVYGLNKNNPDETTLADPFNHYGKSKWQAEKIIENWCLNGNNGKSVTIIRPTVIFGERNRGNVFNLLRQISTKRFIMIGKGNNKKSMAYIGNIVAFISERIQSIDSGLNVYNYSDKPDKTMSELILHVSKILNHKVNEFKLPFFFGMMVGYFFDVISIITKKKYVISSVRVKKFCATTQFNSDKAHSIFEAPFSLEEGLTKTLENEFIKPEKDGVTYYTE